MGVKGLTSYIHSKQDLYFEEILLKDCALIIDGNSLVAHLYNSYLMHTSAFGGDYDKLADETETFFKRLAFNKVRPIVVFDGAVEKRKLATVKIRCIRKVISLQGISPLNYNGNCFPLMMRKVMRNALINMGVVVLQTDFEADSEIAALAKIYGVPVLSNDSDYFIFGVQYIPLPMLDHGNGSNCVIKCKMFRMDKFLRHLKLDSNKLPLLASILGNDYIQRSQLAPFFGQIKMGKGGYGSYSKKLIASVLNWLQSESVESAIQKILSCMRSRGRKVLKEKIAKIMRGYTNISTVLVNYVPEDMKLKCVCDTELVEDELGKLTIESDNELVIESEDENDISNATADQEENEDASDTNSYYSSEGGSVECEKIDVEEIEMILKAGQQKDADALSSLNSEWLMHKSRVGLIPPDVLTFLNLSTYFSTPQPECYEMPYAGEQYMYIIQCMAGLLLGKSEIICWYRQHRNKYERKTIDTVCSSPSFGTFPSLESLGTLSLDGRRSILNDILEVHADNLEHVPEDWQLYFISISYWLQRGTKNELKSYHLHSVIMMLITISVIGERIGFHRRRKSFIKKFGGQLIQLTKSRDKVKYSCYLDNNLQNVLEKVTKEDCIIIFDSLLPYFQIGGPVQHSKHFSNILVHSFAQLQCCISLVSMLNAVLSFPYSDIQVHKFYNGTFLYNIASNFKKRSDILAYVDLFLSKTPSLLNLYHSIYEVFSIFLPKPLNKKSKKKLRKAQTNLSANESHLNVKFDSDSEPFYDVNNKFCFLERQ